jgi:Fe-S oxidoreductase
MPARDTFALLPEGTPLLLAAAALVCAAILFVGLRRRFTGPDLRAALRAPPGGRRAAAGRVLRHALLPLRLGLGARGLPHLALCAGFATLFVGTALVALDWDVARPLGVRLLAGRSYLVFEVVMDAAGALLLAGALAACCRRLFSAASKRRAAESPFGGLLLALIFLGLSGFLLEGLRIALHPAPSDTASFLGAGVAELVRRLASPDAARGWYVALWWTHALATLGLIAALPYSSFLHALAAPLAIATSTGRARADLPAPFDLRELIAQGRFDVAAGASSLADFGPAERLALHACADCGRCDAICPAQLAGSALSPRRLVAALKTEARAGRFGADLLAGVVSAAELRACTTCAACIEACPCFVRPMDYVIGLRRTLVERGQLNARGSTLLADLQRCGNPYGLAAAERAATARELGLEPPAGEPQGEWLFWIGCAGAYDPRVREVVRSSVAVLRAAGLRLAALGAEETCTGDVARRLGEEGLFQQLALANIETLTRHGVRRIVTHCPHCFNTLKNEYPRFGGSFEVVLHADLIARLVAERRIVPAPWADGPVAIHDACYAARYNQALLPARRIAESVPGLERIELPRSGRRTFCCGGGGAAGWADGAAGESPASLRVREAQLAGARTLAVECPFCLKGLQEAAAAEGARGLRVVDIAEIAAQGVP